MRNEKCPFCDTLDTLRGMRDPEIEMRFYACLSVEYWHNGFRKGDGHYGDEELNFCPTCGRRLKEKME